MSKICLVRGQLSVVRSEDHICWTADELSAIRQITNLLPTCGIQLPLMYAGLAQEQKVVW
jgi:hypothetical protein